MQQIIPAKNPNSFLKRVTAVLSWEDFWNAPKECFTINSLCFAHCRHVLHSICWWRGCRLRKHCCALVKGTRAWSTATLLRYVQPLNLWCSHTSCFCRCSLFVSLQRNSQGRTTVHTTGQMQAEKHRSLLLNAPLQASGCGSSRRPAERSRIQAAKHRVALRCKLRSTARQ